MDAAKLSYTNIEVGEAIPPVAKGPVTSELMIRWAAGSGDFSPIHYDKDWALSQGLPGTVIAGPMKAAMLAHYLTNWAGSLSALKSLRCRYRGMDLPGDTLTLYGKVTAKEITKDGGQIVCDIWTQNQRDETTTTGVAKLILPA